MNKVAVPHVPDSCRKGSRRKSLLLGLVACTGFGITSAQASFPPINVLIVAGTNPTAQRAAAVLDTDRTSDSFTVTIVDTGVPVSLAGYQQIYDVRVINTPAFLEGEMTQYLTFLNAAPGNAIFLMGENPNCCGVRDALVNNFITLAGGGTIAP